MRHWVDQMFYVLNTATAALFIFLVLYPILAAGLSESKSPLKWNDYGIIIIWHTYCIFVIFKLFKYLRRPNPDQDLNFLFFLLGLILVCLFVFLHGMTGFQGGWGN